MSLTRRKLLALGMLPLLPSCGGGGGSSSIPPLINNPKAPPMLVQPSSLQAAVDAGSVLLGDGTFEIPTNLVLSKALALVGNGGRSIIKTTPGFAGSPMLTISPTVGLDPKGFILEEFALQNLGGAAQGMLLDLSVAGQYLSKLRISGIISHAPYSSNIFLQLLNPNPNVDGFFTSTIEDCWSFGGYYLDNVGDSVVLQRNTTTGPGRAYYVNQLAGASHISIKDGNSTSEGGILVARGFNVTVDNMQMECPPVFTGGSNAYVSCNGSTVIQNFRLLNSNINTHGVVPQCVYLQNTNKAKIEGNTLFAALNQPHIVLDSAARNTTIGQNVYMNIDGTEAVLRIYDIGTGTRYA